jgi:hypothetical protein
MEFPKQNGCFGHLLKIYHIMRMENHASRSWPVRSLSIRLFVAGSSLAGMVGSRPDPVIDRGTVATVRQPGESEVIEKRSNKASFHSTCFRSGRESARGRPYSEINTGSAFRCIIRCLHRKGPPSEYLPGAEPVTLHRPAMPCTGAEVLRGSEGSPDPVDVEVADRQAGTPPRKLIQEVLSGALSGACTGKDPRFFISRPAPKP